MSMNLQSITILVVKPKKLQLGHGIRYGHITSSLEKPSSQPVAIPVERQLNYQKQLCSSSYSWIRGVIYLSWS